MVFVGSGLHKFLTEDVKNDHLMQSADGRGLFAIQGAPDDPAHQRIHLDKAQALVEPIERSTPQLQQDVLSRPHAQQERDQSRPVVM